MTTEQLVEQYKARPVNSFNDISKSTHEEMEVLFELGGVDLINAVMGSSIADFRHGLPVPNTNPGFKSIEQLAQEYRPVPKTPVENLVALLEVERDCSYETYEDRLQERFGFAQLLGDEPFWESDEGVALLTRELQVNVPLPLLKDEEYMERLREKFELNLNLPGCLGRAFLLFVLRRSITLCSWLPIALNYVPGICFRFP